MCYCCHTDFLVSAAVSEFKGPNIYGVVRLAQVNMELARVEANFSGLPTGKHGWSINEYGDLTRGAASTGKMFNPTTEKKVFFLPLFVPCIIKSLCIRGSAAIFKKSAVDHIKEVCTKRLLPVLYPYKLNLNVLTFELTFSLLVTWEH